MLKFEDKTPDNEELHRRLKKLKKAFRGLEATSNELLFCLVSLPQENPPDALWLQRIEDLRGKNGLDNWKFGISETKHVISQQLRDSLQPLPNDSKEYPAVWLYLEDIYFILFYF